MNQVVLLIKVWEFTIWAHGSLKVLSRWIFMMMMYAFGNFGATALRQQKLHQPSIKSPLLLLLQRHQQKEDIFLSSVVRIKPSSWTWWQCVDVMYQSKIWTTSHFSGKSSFYLKAITLLIFWLKLNIPSNTVPTLPSLSNLLACAMQW